MQKINKEGGEYFCTALYAKSGPEYFVKPLYYEIFEIKA